MTPNRSWSRERIDLRSGQPSTASRPAASAWSACSTIDRTRPSSWRRDETAGRRSARPGLAQRVQARRRRSTARRARTRPAPRRADRSLNRERADDAAVRHRAPACRAQRPDDERYGSDRRSRPGSRPAASARRCGSGRSCRPPETSRSRSWQPGDGELASYGEHRQPDEHAPSRCAASDRCRRGRLVGSIRVDANRRR